MKTVVVFALMIGAASTLAAQTGVAQEGRCTKTPKEIAAAALTVENVDQPAAFLRGPAPKYPKELSQAGITGKVTLRFVVTERGMVDRCSVEVVSSTNQKFEESAITMILASSFRSATIRDVPKAQVVSQTVNFTLSR